MSHPAGPQLFNEWIERMHFRTNREVADYLNLNESTVTKLRKSRRGAGLDMAFYIQRKTGIPAQSWSEDSDMPAAVGARITAKSKADKSSKAVRLG